MKAIEDQTDIKPVMKFVDEQGPLVEEQEVMLMSTQGGDDEHLMELEPIKE